MRFYLFAPLTMITAFLMIGFYAPEEANQGLVQKIFYIHVASAFTMYFGFLITFISGIFFLIDKKRMWDELAVSGAEVGFIFCTLVLVTGPIWAKPIWGTWWTWDPRLTTTLLLWMLYAAYVLLRGFLKESPRRSTTCAILGIIAFLDVPLIHYSVKIWRGVHPTVLTSKGGGIPTSMQYTLVVTFFAMLIWFSALLLARFELERQRNQLIDLKILKEERE